MPQPQAYERQTDFTERDGDDTDHPALNQELDAAALSINQIRGNLALIQRDDGSLKNGVVTPDSLAPETFIALQGNVADAVADAEAAAQSALTSATTANTARDAAVAAAAAAQTSQSAAALNAGTASTAAAAATGAQAAVAASAAAALVSENNADTSEAAALASQNAAAASAAAALADKNAAAVSAAAALVSANGAAASATTATAQAVIATAQASTSTTKAGEAVISAAAAAASQVAAEASALAASGYVTGDVAETFATTARAGFVMGSGRTIGNAASAATERANADTWPLFSLLYASMANTEAAVSGGRGASAAADYAANKTIALPDLRGRAAVGKDDMGGTTASRMTLAGAGIVGTTLGATGGAQTHTLTIAQLPSHNHASSAENTPTQRPVGGGSVESATAGVNGTGFTGGGGAHNNTQPSYIVNKIIKL